MGEARRQKKKQASQFEQINRLFQNSGIDTSDFEFVDHPRFIAAEQRNPALLEDYANWVMLRPRDADYDAHVRQTVPRLTQLIADVLEEDRLEGSCQIACSLLTKSLARLGVWSVGIVGSSTYEVRDQGIRRGLHTVDYRDFEGAALGHSWVCAPPFFVVDASIKRQRWSGDAIYPYIPSIILDDVGRKTKPTPMDVISSRVRTEIIMHRGSLPDNIVYEMEPNLRAFSKVFPATQTVIDQLSARYVPTAANMSDGTLEDINSAGARGRVGGQIWNEVIAPAFHIA
ncbi:hypothetical protein [Pseudoroseicyclus aestuarii]|uniref:Uncharacterized protein n=1 Tax=Pseudoroseicyclus aestuarii TaxID=1795041 RepID=A0A318SRL0_9RHOB|nr:hypothetical protein [Pseudoroseicyclus aestuarii]PYE80872.1 hypothetical protein DFP88_1092 [Pseudoroseicyclus aestuarii]